MKWFKPKYSVCETCKVHYEPSKDGEGFKEFCSLHREPKVLEHRRYQSVMRWAGRNWEKLETEMLKDLENKKESQGASQSFLRQQAQAFAGIGMTQYPSSVGQSWDQLSGIGI